LHTGAVSKGTIDLTLIRTEEGRLIRNIIVRDQPLAAVGIYPVLDIALGNPKAMFKAATAFSGIGLGGRVSR
jgi:hypothetical protein